MAKIGVPTLRVKGRPGAPKGNRNAWKTGLYSAEIKDLRRRIRAWRHRAQAALARADELLAAHRDEAGRDAPSSAPPEGCAAAPQGPGAALMRESESAPLAPAPS